jgi:hypothetical protein
MVYYDNLAMFQPIYINCSRMAIDPFGIAAKYYISQVEKKFKSRRTMTSQVTLHPITVDVI